MPEEITLRPATSGDREFLYTVVRESMGEYIEQTFGAWDEKAQLARFDTSTPPEAHEIVLLDGEPIGCLKVRHTPVAVHLDRVFLLPPFQRRGIGTRLIQEQIGVAAAKDLPLRLQLLRVNPARRLYERLGFRLTGQTGTHYLMEHTE
jgi:GNAT superfamily N-acetyltransferase